MNKLFTILALFLLLAACESTHEEQKQCFEVTFSDALPVQFWLNGCPTYNETLPKGVHYKCFCHPWLCSDELKIQFTDEDEDSFYLSIEDPDGNVIDTINFEASDVVIENPDQIDNYEFEDTINPWTGNTQLIGTGDREWGWSSYNGGSAVVTMQPFVELAADYRSCDLKGNYSTIDGRTYRFRLTGESGIVANDVSLFVYLRNSSTAYKTVGVPQFVGSTFDKTFSITPSQDCDQIIVRVSNLNPSLINSVFIFEVEVLDVAYQGIYNVSFTPSDLDICDESISLKVYRNSSPDVEEAKTDCIQVSQTINNPTVLIEYSNTNNFDGLVYEDVSPEQSFQTRIPAIFFHERFPSDREVVELSNSKIINLNNAMRAQKLLDTDYIPYYMHRKTQLILMHDNVSIDGKEVTYNEAYEIQEGERRWPVKKAKVWLNDRDFVKRNVI